MDVDKATLERHFPKSHVNNLGLIVKESPEKRKVRLVVDMRRSRANARAAVPERPVLPRPRDVIADWEELLSEAASLGFTPEASVSCENVTCDFSDAYCHVLVHPEELKKLLRQTGRSYFLLFFIFLHFFIFHVLFSFFIFFHRLKASTLGEGNAGGWEMNNSLVRSTATCEVDCCKNAHLRNLNPKP